MQKVILYLCQGEFVGNPYYDYEHPEIGAIHSFLLFLREEELSSSLAESEALKFGFGKITIKKSDVLSVEVMNTDSYKGFSGFYEEALSEGSSIVWYPNA